MNLNSLYPILLVLLGVIISTASVIILTRFSNKIIRLFELYPESKWILNISLKAISWFIGAIIFLIFLRWALIILNTEFATNIIETLITSSPRYVLAAFIIMLGFYVSRLIRERSKDYEFEYKQRILLAIDLIVHMTFVFTALYSIGINITFFLEFYRVIVWVIGAIIGIIVSMTIGIPLGMSIHDKMKKEGKQKKRPKKHNK